ncbi:hypothetical protein GCM10022215_22070 [Nocardioides fonticola]|uniref:Mce-associated membrane protein n=1 Tax=Nocardioides fonticola TaxID=450363 RepID=A0ABP7XIY9_9ACTN
MRGRGGRLLAALLVVLLLGVVAGDVVWTLRSRERDRVEDARAAAMAQAAKRLPVLLSYAADDLDADLAAAVASATGPFRDDYRRVLETVVRPNARSGKVSTTAVVDALAVVRGDADRVVVLAFLTQTTTARGREPDTSQSRVEATMQRVGDDWLIAGLDPV